MKKVLEQFRECAVWSKDFVGRRIGIISGTVADALEYIDGAKADKPEAVSFTIPTTGWGSDSTAGYPKYYDITVSGITANDRASVAIAYGSLAAARACGMCPTNETLADRIRIRAAKVPTANITVQYWVEKGKG